jgi:transposase-like protein
VGSIQVRVPQVWDGSYFPTWLEPRRRAERALVGMSKSLVSALCQALDAEVERFRARPLAETWYPYV